MKPHVHYEAAFEDYLRSQQIPFVVVDEAKRAAFRDAKLKSFDFIVYSANTTNWLVDVKGRRWATRKGHRKPAWENWVTEADLEGLKQWEEVFGAGFRALLVFAYWIDDGAEPPPEIVHVRRGVRRAKGESAVIQRRFARLRAGIGEQHVVLARVRPAARAPVIQVPQLDAQHRRLQSVEPRVETHVLVAVLLRLSVYAQRADEIGELRVVGRADPPVAEPAEILRRIEAEAADRTPRPDSHPLRVFRADRLGRVLDDRHSKLTAQLQECFHVRRLTEEMHRHDRLQMRAFVGQSPHVVRVHVVGHGIDIREDRLRAEPVDASVAWVSERRWSRQQKLS